MKARIKNYLIIKLGGVPVTQKLEKPMIVRTEPRNVIKVGVDRTIPNFQLANMSPEEEADAVNRCLANLLGNYLIDNGCVKISVRENEFGKVYHGSIEIVKGGEVDDETMA
jgi:hypothetical protein